ncbi:hypothetical protein BJY52DRAFT_1184710 [Lactarius psammicola]|nr:hypothetical protein BJY52DRAFT_1184710 [Lactarius psammicola]
MADDIELSCLIEGTKQPFDVFISRNSNGNALRKNIFENGGKDWASGERNLTMLKVNMDSDRPRLPQLRLNRGDKGVEEISVRQMISEIWREPPPTGRIHIFVTFTDLSSEFEGRRIFLDAAHRVYYECWGKNLDELLRPVPECNDFKYIAKEQIHSLGIRDLNYRADVLLVRKEYKDAYEELRSWERNPLDRGGGAVVLGHPGIGKTCFLYYLLFRLLSERKTVAFQVGEDFVLFQDTGIQRCRTTSSNGLAISSGTWALTDSEAGFERPCDAFLKACAAGRAWVVQTTSPSRIKYGTWSKEQDATLFWMQVFPSDELIALGKILGLDIESLRNNYDSWGPSARVCIRLTKTPTRVRGYENSVVEAADELTMKHNDFADFTTSATNKLFIIGPKSPSQRQESIVEFGTNRLRGYVARAYAKRDHAKRLSFYKAIRGHSLFGSPAGQMFEIYVLLWFWYSRAEEILPCTGAVATSPHLEIPACPENLEFFPNPEGLKEVKEPERPICWVPTSRTFPSLDAFVLTNDTVITLQMTISRRLDANERPRRCHVFITDTDDYAKSLREQNLKEIPKGTFVYSAVIDINELDSIVTETRVDKLEEARASPSNDPGMMDTSEDYE